MRFPMRGFGFGPGGNGAGVFLGVKSCLIINNPTPARAASTIYKLNPLPMIAMEN